MREGSALIGAGSAPFGIAVGIGAAVVIAAAGVAAVLLGPAEVSGRLVVVSMAVAATRRLCSIPARAWPRPCWLSAVQRVPGE